MKGKITEFEVDFRQEKVNIERKSEKIGEIILFHGTSDRIVVPTYGKSKKGMTMGWGFT